MTIEEAKKKLRQWGYQPPFHLYTKQKYALHDPEVELHVSKHIGNDYLLGGVDQEDFQVVEIKNDEV